MNIRDINVAIPMKACCDKWLLDLTPNRPREGEFVEERACPTCKARHRVVFEYHYVMGHWEGTVFGTE